MPTTYAILESAVNSIFSGAKFSDPVVLAGDASTRRYFRTKIDGVGSVVLMLALDEKHVSDFTRMTGLMNKLGADVPHIFGSRGRVSALEDLGDISLQAKVQNMDGDEIEDEYRNVIDTLLDFQARTSKFKDRDNPCFEHRFDLEKLMWEVEFANEHFIDNYLGHAVSPDEKTEMQDEWKIICTTLAKTSKTLAHRDFHSRNIMIAGNRRVWIDYQDARMGRRQYDLASLLLDPYVDISPEVEMTLVDYYYDGLQKINKHPISHERFIKMYQLSGVQRLYKALGTFGYQSTAGGVDVYKEYIPKATATLRRVMKSSPDLTRLLSVMNNYL